MVTRDKRASRWDAHRATRRAELVNAAILAIRERGAGVGMDEVAAQAGTSKTVVYRHFGDRTELYLAVCVQVADVLLAQVRAAIDAAPGARTKVAAGIEAYLRLIEGDPEVYRFVVHRPLVDRTPAADPVADLVSLIGDEAAAQLRHRGADPDIATTWGHGLVGLIRGAGDRWLTRTDGTTRRQMAERITDLAWSGLSGLVPTPHEEGS